MQRTGKCTSISYEWFTAAMASTCVWEARVLCLNHIFIMCFLPLSLYTDRWDPLVPIRHHNKKYMGVCVKFTTPHVSSTMT
jgi:hypothetical protein